LRDDLEYDLDIGIKRYGAAGVSLARYLSIVPEHGQFERSDVVITPQISSSLSIILHISQPHLRKWVEATTQMKPIVKARTKPPRSSAAISLPVQ
jgi:hypothetical protein